MSPEGFTHSAEEIADPMAPTIVSDIDIELMNVYGDTIDPSNYTNPNFARIFEEEEVTWD